MVEHIGCSACDGAGIRRDLCLRFDSECTSRAHGIPCIRPASLSEVWSATMVLGFYSWFRALIRTIE